MYSCLVMARFSPVQHLFSLFRRFGIIAPRIFNGEAFIVLHSQVRSTKKTLKKKATLVKYAAICGRRNTKAAQGEKFCVEKCTKKKTVPKDKILPRINKIVTLVSR